MQDAPASADDTTPRRNGMRRTPFGAKVRTRVQSEAQQARPARVRTSDWREHGKGRNWPALWMSEKDFQAHVESVADGLGWKSSHAHLPFFDTAGIPDLAMVNIKPGRERALFVELKVRSVKGDWRTPKGKQADWIAWMLKAGLDVRVWLWPDDDDAIYEELAL